MEMSIVISVIVLLVIVTFMGVNTWRNSANNASCLLNLATIQKAARTYQDLYNLNAGEALSHTSFIGPGNLLEAEPVCPSDPSVPYNYLSTVPPTGTAYATCPFTPPHAPSPTQLAAW
jgi:hypothetical protein